MNCELCNKKIKSEKDRVKARLTDDGETTYIANICVECANYIEDKGYFL